MKNKINSCSFGADEITSHFVTGLYTDKLKTPPDSVACRTSFKTSRLKGDHRCLSYCQNWILIPDYFILFYHSHVCFLSFLVFHKIMPGSPSSTGKMGSGLDCFVDAIPHAVVFPAASRWRQTLTSCSLFLVRLSFCSGNNKCDYML